jgi:hypothetical protein
LLFWTGFQTGKNQHLKHCTKTNFIAMMQSPKNRPAVHIKHEEEKMETQIVKRGVKDERDLFIANLNSGEDEDSKGAVSHPKGSDEVNIRSTHQSYGTIPVSGREYLKLLRDALIEICRMEGIE